MRSQFVSKQFKIHNLKFKEVKTLQELTRPNIWKLKPYSSARDEYKGVTASVFLDANEKSVQYASQPLSGPYAV